MERDGEHGNSVGQTENETELNETRIRTNRGVCGTRRKETKARRRKREPASEMRGRKRGATRGYELATSLVPRPPAGGPLRRLSLSLSLFEFATRDRTDSHPRGCHGRRRIADRNVRSDEWLLGVTVIMDTVTGRC